MKTHISRLNEQNGQDETLVELNKRKNQLHKRADEIKELTKLISQLRAQVSQLKRKSSEVDSVVDLKALKPLNIELRDNVDALQSHNERYKAENAKNKTNSLVAKIEKLKAELKGKMQPTTIDVVKPRVLAPGKFAIDVDPIPPPQRNNRDAHIA
ncbi:hypothetical protein Tco_0234271 [Tanacetum coccineum]